MRAGQRVLKGGNDVVAELESVHVAIGGDEAGDQHEVRLILGDTDTLRLHRVGQQRSRQRQLVLYLNLGDVRIGPLLEGNGDREGAAGIAGRADVAQVIEPVELLLDDRSEEHTYELQSLMRISVAVFCL